MITKKGNTMRREEKREKPRREEREGKVNYIII